MVGDDKWVVPIVQGIHVQHRTTGVCNDQLKDE